MKKKKNSELGFSIVEILVAMGLLGVTSFGVMKLFENTNKVSKEIQTKDEIFQLQTEIGQILSNPINCQSNLFKTKLGDKPMKSGIGLYRNGVYAPGLDVVPKSSKIRDVLVKTTISETTIKEVKLIEPDGSQALVDLEIKFRKPDNMNRTGGEEVTRILKLSASLCPRYFSMGNICPNGQTKIDSGGSNTPWVVCQDCNVDLDGNKPISNNSKIMSCFALGFGHVPSVANTQASNNPPSNCDLEKEVFFQSMEVGKRKTICGKDYSIVQKRELYTDTSQRLSVIIPANPNIIRNSFTLHLVGGGGGGVCKPQQQWGEGGENGEVKIVNLNHLVNGGENLLLKIGKGGKGQKSGQLACGTAGQGSLEPGEGTHVVFRSGIFYSEFKVNGGSASKDNNTPVGPLEVWKDDANLTSRRSGRGVTFAGVQYSGGQPGWFQFREGGNGQIGSGGGSSYMSEKGGDGGDGAVALTWLEWIQN
jgi:hypothetical protein